MIPETIVAPATAPGQSGISVIRVSGARSFEACSSVCGDLGKPRMLKNCSIKNSSGEVIDSALVAFFVGPSSYTGEDVVEIHCHGNPVIVDMVIQEILSKGVRVGFIMFKSKNNLMYQYRFGDYENFKKRGLFWTASSKLELKEINRVFNFVINTKQNAWIKKTKPYAEKVINFDYKNKVFKKIIKNL